jgi:hypothetical protein
LGIRWENGENCSYWLECNTGDVYRHIPSIDNLAVTGSLYSGDGTVSSGVDVLNSLDCRYINGMAYYYYNGVRWGYDFSQTYVVGGSGEIWE